METASVLTEESVCSKCLVSFPEEEAKAHDEKKFCKACFKEALTRCSTCRKEVLREKIHEIDGKRLCGGCFNRDYKVCGACGGCFKTDETYYSELYSYHYCDDCKTERVAYCTHCDSELDARNCARRSDGRAYCEDCYEQAGDGEEYIQNHEFSSERFRRCRSRRKFGVEIETILREGNHLPVEELDCWSKQKDGSLGDSGMEFASPILQGDDGFREIERFTGRLFRCGYFVSKACGLHVHIDGRDLTYEDVKKLLKAALSYEAVIYAMLPESRHMGSYSVPLAKFPKSRLRFRVKDEAGLKKLWYGRRNERVNLKSKFHHSRYFGVNIHSWFFRRSIEFRYHSGTMNPVKITNFVRICQAFVDRAKRSNQVRLMNFDSFSEQFDSFVRFLKLSKKTRDYISERIMKFHPEKFSENALLEASSLK